MGFFFFFHIVYAMTNISSKTNFYPDVLADFQIHTNLIKIMVNQALFKSFSSLFLCRLCLFWWKCIQISFEIAGPIYTKLICRDTHAGSGEPLVQVFNKYKYNIQYKNNVVLFHSERTKLVTYYCIRLGDLLFVFLMGCGIFYTIRINNCIIVFFCLLSIEYLLHNLKRFNRFDSLYYKKLPNHKKIFFFKIAKC